MSSVLYLTRHGESESSRADLYYGRSSSPVIPEGREHVELLALRLSKIPIAAVYCSPIERCLQAATSIAQTHNLKPVSIKELVEIDHGKWEGLTRAQVNELSPETYRLWQMDPASNSPEGGESGYAVASRAVPKVIRLVRSHPGESVVVMAHNTVNRILLCHFLGLPIIDYRRRIRQGPGALNCIIFNADGSYQVTLMNDISHWKDSIL